MKDLLKEHKEWTKSPVGFWAVVGVIVAGVGSIYVPIYLHKKDSKTPSADAPAAPTSLSQSASSAKSAPGAISLLPDEIDKEIRTFPPYQRPQAAKDYVGLFINWNTYFHSIYESALSPGKIVVNLKGKDSATGNSWLMKVSTKVDLSEYPQLKTAKEGKPVQIRGKIEKIDELYISVKDATLEFP